MVGVKDKGYQSVYFVTKPNELVFMDLYGTMKDGNYIIIMTDAFDGYTILVSLNPLFELNALSIIKVILFKWIYVLGIMEQIVCDNGSNLVRKLNKFSHYIFGVLSKDFFAYSPWVNGRVESKMKWLTRGCMIGNYHRELLGTEDIHSILNDAYEQETNYRDFLPGIMLCHNANIHPGTKMTPNELRFGFNSANMLDIELKLSGIKKVKKSEYIKNNVIDFKAFKALLQRDRRNIRAYAKKNNMQYLINKKNVNDTKSLKNTLIYRNDYIVLKKNFKQKSKTNHEYGWVVMKVLFTNNKMKFRIKNIFTKE